MSRETTQQASDRIAAAAASSILSQEEERRVLEKVEKLLNMRGRTPEETATYAQKAQDLLLAYNLSEDRLGEGSESGQRAEEKLRGGFYEYERDLWRLVADLNFCLYWSSWVEVPRTQHDVRTARMSRYAQRYRKERQHRLVGRRVNVTATKNMMTYLLGAIERMTREWLGDNLTTGLRSRRAVSFREGLASDVYSRLWDRRQEQIRDEDRKAEEARRAAERAGMATASSSTALTISSVRKSEKEANLDHIYGEGFSARRAARIARQAEADRIAQEAYTKWAAENPDEAARQEAEAAKKRRSRRYSAPREKDRDWGAYSAGSERGSQISLEPQVARRDDRALPSS